MHSVIQTHSKPRVRSFFLALLALVCPLSPASTLSGQTSKPLAALPAGFEFSGIWGCEGSFRTGAFHRAEFTGSSILGGKWLELTERDIEPATGYVAKYLIGYDAQARHLVEFDANNFGASTFSSDEGWQNGSLTMISAVSTDPTAPYAVNRFIYTVAGEDSFTVDWQVSKTAALTWILADHLTCKRPSNDG